MVLVARNTNTNERDTNIPLSDAKVRALKAKDAAYKVSDTEGLYLLVSTTAPICFRSWGVYLGVSLRSLLVQGVLGLGLPPPLSVST